MEKNFSTIREFFLSRDIYSEQEIKENTNTKDCMDMLKIVCTRDFHGRTLKEEEILEVTDKITSNKTSLYNTFTKSIELFNKINFPEIDGYKKKKYLLNRGNAFSLLLAIALNYENIDEIDMDKLEEKIITFCNNIPKDFETAARNSVMERKQREIRNKYMNDIIRASIV